MNKYDEIADVFKVSRKNKDINGAILLSGGVGLALGVATSLIFLPITFLNIAAVAVAGTLIGSISATVFSWSLFGAFKFLSFLKKRKNNKAKSINKTQEKNKSIPANESKKSKENIKNVENNKTVKKTSRKK